MTRRDQGFTLIELLIVVGDHQHHRGDRRPRTAASPDDRQRNVRHRVAQDDDVGANGVFGGVRERRLTRRLT